MNEKITFPQLATLLADRAGRSKRFSEDFLREFFILISERLEAGESVKVKGLGTFRLSRVEPRRSVDVNTGEPMEISGHSKVVFVPSKELAEAVNAPFEAFTAIEIADDADLTQLAEFNEPESSEPEPLPSRDEQQEEETAEEDQASDSDESTDSDETADMDETDTEDEEDPEDALHADRPEDTEDMEDSTEAEDSTMEEDAEDSEDAEAEPSKKGSRRILLISFVAAMVAIIAILSVWYFYFNDDFRRIVDRVASATAVKTDANQAAGTETDSIALPSSIATDASDSADTDGPHEAMAEEVHTEPSDAVVYDTIGTTRYLTTMAKEHYGNYNLWPYIYEENKAMLGHPDRIRPGTPVVIPNLSKYGVDPKKPEEIEKAKKMGVEIYGRFGKKI